MEPINEVDLKDVLKRAATDLINQRYEDAIGIVKKQLMKQSGLIEDIKKMKNEIFKKEQSLEKVNQVIAKLREGDWSVLQNQQNQSKHESV